MGRCTLEDVMREFQMNGSDSPYNPDEDGAWGKYPGNYLPTYKLYKFKLRLLKSQGLL